MAEKSGCAFPLLLISSSVIEGKSMQAASTRSQGAGEGAFECSRLSYRQKTKEPARRRVRSEVEKNEEDAKILCAYSRAGP